MGGSIFGNDNFAWELIEDMQQYLAPLMAVVH